MPKIPAPKLPEGHPNRDLLCQEAMETEFLSLGDRAHRAGWSQEEVAMAFIELADNYFLINANLEMVELPADVVLLAMKRH